MNSGITIGEQSMPVLFAYNLHIEYRSMEISDRLMFNKRCLETTKEKYLHLKYSLNLQVYSIVHANITQSFVYQVFKENAILIGLKHLS